MLNPRLPLVRTGFALVLLASLVVASLAAPPPADAASEFKFTGRGYGHAVGMSQWGAWAAAKDGVGFREIIAHYYPNTTLDALSPANPDVTVKLSSQPWLSVYTITQYFAGVGLYPVGGPMTLVKYDGSGESQETIPMGSFLSASQEGSGVYVTTPAGKQGPFTKVEARPAVGGRVTVQFRTSATSSPLDAREYWGKIRLQPSSISGKLHTYNIVPLELYLRSIGEVEYDWGQPSSGNYALEAVKAQAVAARSYAMTHKDPYLQDNQYHQVYLGYTGRSKIGAARPFELLYPGIPAAAEQTAGLVARYNGKIISTFFSSHSGGWTSDTSIWQSNPTAHTPEPYLIAKADPWSLKAPLSNPGFNWTFTISASSLSSAVAGMRDIYGLSVNVGSVSEVEVWSRDTSDPTSHARTIKLTGDRGSAVVGAERFRSLFGYDKMRSTLILDINGSSGVVAEKWLSHVVVTTGAPGSVPSGDQPLTPVVFQTKTINASSINVRSGPGTNYPVVEVLGPNVPITVYAWQHGLAVGSEERWYRLDKPIYTTLTGADRYETAILVSKQAYPSGAPAVALVKGDDFPDALSAAPLAYAFGGPVILTPSGGLTSAVKAELKRLKPGKVFFIGLPESVRPSLVDAVGSADIVTIRGKDRYETAALLAAELKTKVGTVEKFVLAPGNKFPDALSVAPLAAKKGWPILLTPQASGSLPKVTSAQIKALGATSALVVGTYEKPPGIQVVSKVGKDRYDTSALIAEYGKSLGLSFAHLALATGENYPDALVAGPYLAKGGGVLLLTHPDYVPSYVRTQLVNNRDAMTWVELIGMADSVIPVIVKALM